MVVFARPTPRNSNSSIYSGSGESDFENRIDQASDSQSLTPGPHTLTKATIEKLTPLTNIVKESVEGVSEARLSLQEQTETIRNAMNLLAGEMSDLLAENRVGIDQKNQIKSLINLKESIDALNNNLERNNKSTVLNNFIRGLVKR